MNSFDIYSSLPIWLQNVACSLHGYKLDRQRYGGDYEEIFNHLLTTDNASREDIIRYKEEEIYRTLHHAYNHCPYYREKYQKAGVSPDDFKGLDDLVKFPLLTKDEVRENWQGMIADNVDHKSLIPYHTSGSTGKALDFFWTNESLKWYWATVWRGRNRFGVKKGDAHVNFSGKLVVPLLQRKPPYWRYNRALNQCMVNMQHITKDKIADLARLFDEKKPLFLVGYPSIIYTAASLMLSEGIVPDYAPAFAFPSAEKLYSYQKEAIERVFPGIRIVEHYGFSENAAAASKCVHGYYHEDWEMGHLELNDAESTGQSALCGRLLATGLKNKGMPFIRYEIGDTATFDTRPCECGMHSQVVLDIEGRNEDFVITPEGQRIMRWDYIFKDSTGIREAQIVQKELGAIVIRIVKSDNYRVDEERRISKFINENISPTINVHFEYVDEIPRTKAGKFRAVVSELKR